MTPERNLASFLAFALAVEDQAADRCGNLAEAMAVCLESKLESLFRTMAERAAERCERIIERARGLSDPVPASQARAAAPPDDKVALSGDASPVPAPTPQQALELALSASRKAGESYWSIATATEDSGIRSVATDLGSEQEESATTFKRWLNRYPDLQAVQASDSSPSQASAQAAPRPNRLAR